MSVSTYVAKDEDKYRIKYNQWLVEDILQPD